MATERPDHSAPARIETIFEEIRVIRTVIAGNLPELPNKPDLVEELIRRCDGLALQLDEIRAELLDSISARSARGMKNPDPSPNGSGLQA
jgi:hypothetical protein